MVNNWLKFNESYDNPSDILLEKMSEIRAAFLDIEELNIIQYTIHLKGVSYSLIPGETNIDLFFKKVLPVFINQFKIKIKMHQEINILISVNIKLPTNYKVNTNAIIDYNGVVILDDILVSCKTLNDIGYHIELDLNSNHHLYKPIIVNTISSINLSN